MAGEFPGSGVTPPPMTSGILERTRRLILSPTTEWTRIDAEPMTTGAIMRGWVLPLAAIGPVAGLIGGAVFGYGALGFHYRPAIGFLVTQAVLGYAMAVLGTWVLAMAIDALAPNFGGTRNPIQALKVAAFSAAAGWVAGVFGVFPPLGFLGLLGLYSMYLLWIELPMLMRAPRDRTPGYVVVTILVAALIFIVIGAITSAVAWQVAPPGAFGGTEIGSAPGVAGKLDNAAGAPPRWPGRQGGARAGYFASPLALSHVRTTA